MTDLDDTGVTRHILDIVEELLIEVEELKNERT